MGCMDKVVVVYITWAVWIKWWFCFRFFVLFIIYWIAGFMFMKFVRRAEGVETIPPL